MNNNIVLRMIKESFLNSKKLLIERLILLLLTSAALLSSIYFFYNFYLIIFLLIVHFLIDRNLCKSRAKFLNNGANKLLFSSVIPLSTRDKYFLRIYENLFNNFLLYNVFSFFLTIFLFEYDYFFKSFCIYILTIAHIVAYCSSGIEFRVVDQDVLLKKKTLKESFLFLFYLLLCVVFCLLIIIEFMFIYRFSLGVRNFASTFLTYSLVIILADIYLLRKMLSVKWNIPNEHEKLKIFKKPISYRIKKVLFLFFAFFLINILSIPLLKKIENVDKSAYLVTEKLGMSSFELYDSIKKNDLEMFKRLDPFANIHSEQYKWYNGEALLIELFQNNRMSFLFFILGEDPSQWDEKICKITDAKKCKNGIALYFSFRVDGFKVASFLLESPNYAFSDEYGEKILLQASQNCRPIVFELLKKGVNPKIPLTQSKVDVFTMMSESENYLCRDLISKILLSHYKKNEL